MRTYYAHPVDVLRKFSPTVDMSFLEEDRYLGSHDLEKVVARIEEVEGEFESETRNPQRMDRRGVSGSPSTYEQQDASLWRNQGGVKIWLDNTDVVPLDPGEGDVLELRTGRDSWRDITALEGDRWEMHHRDGWLRVFSRYKRHIWREVARDRIVRTTYRYNGLGGQVGKPGETTLSAGAAADPPEASLEVDDPARLPPRGPCLVGGDEYVRIEQNDHDGPVAVDRGVRGTEPVALEAGDTVHHCPVDLRSAVAAKAAVELVRYDDHPEELPTPDDSVSHKDKMEDWDAEFERAKRRYSKVRNV